VCERARARARGAGARGRAERTGRAGRAAENFSEGRIGEAHTLVGPQGVTSSCASGDAQIFFFGDVDDLIM